MPLWIITNNKRWKSGTIFEESDWGVQEAVTETVNNRIKVLDTKGLIMPVEEIRPYARKLMRRGYDRG